MRILVIVTYYFPYVKSSAPLLRDLGVAFQRQGHEVTILTIDDSTGAKPLTVNVEEGLTVLRVSTGKIVQASRIVRTLNEIRFSSTIWWHAGSYLRDNPCDLVVCYAPSIFYGNLVKRLRRVWSCPSYLIMRDLFPQWAVDAGILKPGLVHWYFKQRERQLYDSANVIGVQTPANLHFFEKQGWQDRYTLEVLYNWMEITDPPAPKVDHRQRLNLSGKTVFFYGGNIGVAQGMERFLRLAEQVLDREDIHFLIVGDGSEVGWFRDGIKAKKLTNTTLHPTVNQATFLEILSQIDVGLVFLDYNLKTHNFPGKALAYMNCSLPVLASVNPGNDMKEIIEKADAGFIIADGDDVLLKKNLLLLADDVELRRRMGNNSHQLLKKDFSSDNAARQILAKIFPDGR